MPNWVSNSLDNWTPELYEKYRGNPENEDDKDYAIDFDKIIPEPEEITNTISGSINDDAKKVVEYDKWKNSTQAPFNKYESPLYGTLHHRADNAATSIGYSAIENPDKTLNQMVSEDVLVNNQYKYYTSLFGNTSFHKMNNEQFMQSCENYCTKMNEMFLRTKSSDFNQEVLDDYKDISEYGEHLNNLKEKYGVDNWYDWRIINWGTKWNACESNYDPESQSLTFDTAWSVPNPIFAKIAEDNPETNVEIYSEEETGWFVNSKLKDGHYQITNEGELRYEDEDEEYEHPTEVITAEYNPPKVCSYNELVAENANYQTAIINKMRSL